MLVVEAVLAKIALASTWILQTLGLILLPLSYG